MLLKCRVFLKYGSYTGKSFVRNITSSTSDKNVELCMLIKIMLNRCFINDFCILCC